MMASFEGFLNKAKDTAQSVGHKAVETVDKVKLRMEINSVEKQIASVYEGLGRLVFDAEESGQDITEAKAAAIETVKQEKVKLEALQDKLMEFTHGVRCPKCGTVNDQGAAYCSKCGEKLPDVAKETPVPSQSEPEAPKAQESAPESAPESAE